MSEEPDRPAPRHPEDRESNDDPGKIEDDSPVERYRNSPGLAASRPLRDEGEVPEPNEPG